MTDIDESKRALADELGARWLEPAEALAAAADVYAPCALGGVLDHDSVALLRAPIVAGAANNQLADDDVAELLVERGVLWAPDFVVNAGGIINISVELEPARLRPAPRAQARARDRRHAAAHLRRRAATRCGHRWTPRWRSPTSALAEAAGERWLTAPRHNRTGRVAELCSLRHPVRDVTAVYVRCPRAGGSRSCVPT